MARVGVSALVHPWLGELYWHERPILIGSIEIDPAIREPRSNGGRDAEILLEVATPDLEPSLQARRELRCPHQEGPDRPQDWFEHCPTQPGRPLIDRLFLDGIEVDAQHDVSVIFDFGDLDQLVVRLNDQGHGTAVFVRP